jgi:hypothetical protein
MQPVPWQDLEVQISSISLKSKPIGAAPLTSGRQTAQRSVGVTMVMNYAIKTNQEDPTHPGGLILTPHNEYFCYRLSHAAGLAAPVARLVRLPDGLWFGSRWEGGSLERWWEQAIQGTLDKTPLLPILAKIYAFDLFVHNVDRHAKNYIVRQQFHGPSVMAFNYSRAWTYHGFPLPDLPMDENENTVCNQRYFSEYFGRYVTVQAASSLLGGLAQVTTKHVEQILSEQPSNWLPRQTRDAILYWWDSADRLARIESIHVGINNGTLL